ncbi:hypothetical protein DdX_19190 [Ditylenchus destructor]|uniref:Uncharacterized protein n=1 Tax=Ditylenchus destructor TaxID=166010 RepID=A0AAD4QXL7_9BILA|nr:hypothetical protein DdX_19190 [Ditylenchus destructor]
MAFARLSQPELLKLFEKSESDSISIKAKLNAVQSENEALLTENKQAKTTVLNLSSAVARLSETNLKLVSQNEELHRKCIELESSAKTTSNNAIAYGSPPKCFNTHSTEACSIQPMSCSKHLPPFTFDVLCYLNRDGLERFSIDCRPLKNLIERYFHSKPYRVFDQLWIRGGLYALCHNYGVQWHPNREDYSVQQFLGRKIYLKNARWQ